MGKTKIQTIAYVFALFFLLVVLVTNIPMFNDERGYNFGLYKIDPADNVIHFLTAVISAICGWYSAKASKWFLILFGALYGLDATAGLFFQRGLLDLTLFTELGGSPDFGLTNLFVNLPHIAIAAVMIWLGITVGRKVRQVS